MKLTPKQAQYMLDKIDALNKLGESTNDQGEIMTCAVELIVLGVLAEIHNVTGDGGTEI